MKKKIYGRTTAVIIAIVAAITLGAVGKNIVSAAESRQSFIPKSYGRFIYDDSDMSNNNGHEHDLLIDASDFADIAENINNLNYVTEGLVETVVRKNDVIDTLEEIKENTEEYKAAGANVVKELIQAFQDGVSKIYDKLSGLGFTPTTNSPDGIIEAIDKMYEDRYNEGKKAAVIYTRSINYSNTLYGLRTATVSYSAYINGFDTNTYRVIGVGISKFNISKPTDGRESAYGGSATASVSCSNNGDSFNLNFDLDVPPDVDREPTTVSVDVEIYYIEI